MKTKHSHITRQFQEDNPTALRGLHQAAYVMSCLCEGKSIPNIVQKFQGDHQLVAMWVNFLKHNHWVEFDGVNNDYKITDKGLRQAAREMLTN